MTQGVVSFGLPLKAGQAKNQYVNNGVSAASQLPGCDQNTLYRLQQ